jgi:COMPASS component SDC1
MANVNTPTNQAAGGSHTPAADSSISASNSNPVRPGGAPARVYMNEKIVPYLLEGMKNVTKEQYVLSHLLIACFYRVWRRQMQ